MWHSRAVLSIPFHIACTTYVACCLAQQQFLYSRCSTSLELTDIIDPPPELALLNPASASNIIELSGSLPPPCDRTEPNSSVPTGWFQKALLYFSSLLVPSLLHGFYDAGLFLALQVTKKLYNIRLTCDVLFRGSSLSYRLGNTTTSSPSKRIQKRNSFPT